jgi:hypothetical protein
MLYTSFLTVRCALGAGPLVTLYCYEGRLMQGDWAATTLRLKLLQELHTIAITCTISIAITLRDHVMNVVGIDVGYSNLKLAYGPADGALKNRNSPPLVQHRKSISGVVLTVVRKMTSCMFQVNGTGVLLLGVSTDRAEMWGTLPPC